MASAGDVPGARAAVATLAPFWDGAVRGRTRPAGSGWTAGLLGKALRAADAVAEHRPRRGCCGRSASENLTEAQLKPFAKIADAYGQQLDGGTAADWFGGVKQAWEYGVDMKRPRWVADSAARPVRRLHATGGDGAAAAHSSCSTWPGRGSAAKSARTRRVRRPAAASGNSAAWASRSRPC